MSAVVVSSPIPFVVIEKLAQKGVGVHPLRPPLDPRLISTQLQRDFNLILT